VLLSGPVHVTAEGGARARHPETSGVLVLAPGRGGGGIAADPAHAAVDTVTATSRAQDTSKYTNTAHFLLTLTLTSSKLLQLIYCALFFFFFKNKNE